MNLVNQVDNDTVRKVIGDGGSSGAWTLFVTTNKEVLSNLLRDLISACVSPMLHYQICSCKTSFLMCCACAGSSYYVHGTCHILLFVAYYYLYTTAKTCACMYMYMCMNQQLLNTIPASVQRAPIWITRQIYAIKRQRWRQRWLKLLACEWMCLSKK